MDSKFSDQGMGGRLELPADVANMPSAEGPLSKNSSYTTDSKLHSIHWASHKCFQNNQK